MRGMKTIDLGFEIVYSKDGQFHPSTTVTVRAPGLSQYRVHSLMQAWTTEGAIGFRKAYAAEMEKARIDAENGLAPEGGKKKDANEEVDVMAMMAAGLSPERYADFSEFVLKTLRNNQRLAFVGDDPNDPKAGITDHVADQIFEKGGIAGFERIMSEFAGFFMLGQKSEEKPSGNDSATTSDSPSKDTSPQPKRVNSRLQR